MRSLLPTLKNVEAARRRISQRATATPLVSSHSLNQSLGFAVEFKCENLQRTGSFKFRGALNAVLRLTPSQRKQGVVTHSSGNHGAALAAIARDLDVPATIVVPRGAMPVKRAAIRRYGARIVGCGNTLASREASLEQVRDETGAHFIPPYDHPAVIAGQGTTALEIVEQSPEVEEIWVPVGGGGLVSGTIAAVGRRIQVVGAEPELARDAYDSMRSGVRQPPLPPRTSADGLRTALGHLNFEVMNRYALPIHLVTEAEIGRAQNIAMARLKVVIEPSSAVPLAALLKYGPYRTSTRRVAMILSGGNVAMG